MFLFCSTEQNGAQAFEKLYSNASFQKSLTRLLLTIHTPCWLQLTGGTTFFHNREQPCIYPRMRASAVNRWKANTEQITWQLDSESFVRHRCSLMPPQVTFLTLGSDGHPFCVLSELNEWGQLKCFSDAFNTNCIQQQRCIIMLPKRITLIIGIISWGAAVT